MRCLREKHYRPGQPIQAPGGNIGYFTMKSYLINWDIGIQDLIEPEKKN